jgi:hypothetical protein
MAKRAREQAVKEKRERKLERKQAAAAARLAGDIAPEDGATTEDSAEDETVDEDGAPAEAAERDPAPLESV